jgi:hypothetical protein
MEKIISETYWIPLIQFPDTHEINNLGYVRDANKKILKQHLCMGYPSIHIYIKSKRKKLFIHRLLGQHFIENPENKPTINHINGIKTDNRLNNLEWATQAEQNKHAYDIGLKRKTKGQSKIVLNTLTGIFYDSAKEAAESIGVHQHTFRCWLNGSSKNKSPFIYA